MLAMCAPPAGLVMRPPGAKPCDAGRTVGWRAAVVAAGPRFAAVSIDPTRRPRAARGTNQRRVIEEGSFAFLRRAGLTAESAKRVGSGEWRNLATFPHNDTN